MFLGPHPTHHDHMVNKKAPPFCDLLAIQNNKDMASWLIPYIAKFVHPKKIKLCSVLKSLMDVQSQIIVEKMREKMCSLKHASRLRG